MKHFTYLLQKHFNLCSKHRNKSFSQFLNVTPKNSPIQKFHRLHKTIYEYY